MERPPHLRSVPSGEVEEVDAPPAIQMGAVEPAPQHIAPVIGLGDMAAPVSTGALAGLGTHALAVGVTGVTGAGVGYLASGGLQGAAIGAGVQLTLLGVAGAFFGGARVPTWMRVAYGVLGVGSALGAGYLVWQRR